MKKSLIFVGLLSLGMAYAQEGKVGINTDAPKATLDIKAYNTEGEQAEGVLIPRLGKTAVAKIASPETSTLLYIDNVSYATVNPGADARVAKVDVVGFYHYDGTQWVRIADENNELWNRRISGTNGQVYLVPAENKGDFIGYKYQTEDAQKYGRFSFNLGNPTADDFKNGNEGVGIDFEGMPFSTNITSDVLPKTSGTGTTWYFNRNNSVLKDAHATTSSSIYYGGEYRLVARDISNLANINVLRGLQSAVDLFSTGTGKANNVIGFEATTRAGSDNGTYKPTVNNNIAGQFNPRNYGVSTSLVGLKTTIYNHNVADNIRGLDINAPSQNSAVEHTVKNLRGINNAVKLTEKGTLSGELVGTYNTVEISKGTSTPSSSNVRGNYNRIVINSDTNLNTIESAITNYTSTINTTGANKIREYVDYSVYPNSTSDTTEITNYYGFRVNTGSKSNLMSVGTMYGMKIDNIEKGSAGNYAIHTGEKGDVRIGTLKGTGNRQVIADADGVLKTIDSTTPVPVKVGGANITCNASNEGTINYGQVTYEGKATGAFGFCIKNSSNEYVWAYMIGGPNFTSSSGVFGQF